MSALQRCFLLFALINADVHLGTSADFNTSSCVNNVLDPSNNMIVYIGWPHKILCDPLADDLDYVIYKEYDASSSDADDDYYSADDYTIVCIIMSENGTQLFNETTTLGKLFANVEIGYLLLDIQHGDPVDFTLQAYVPSLGKCLSQNIHLTLKPFEHITCEEFMEKDDAYNPAKIGTDMILTCNAETEPMMYAEDVKYQWTRNCSTIPQDLRNDTKKVRIHKVGFDHAGLYVCSVRYNGMTRYMKTETFCVQYPISWNKQTLSCKNTNVHQNPSKNATFECEVNFGQGTFTDNHISLFWMKQFPNGSLARKNRCFSSYWQQHDSGRVQCLYTIENKPCLLHIASEEERENRYAIISVRLTVRDIEHSDYGIYMITSSTSFTTSTDVNVTMMLSKDPTQRQRKTLVAMTTCVGALISIAAIMAIVTYKNNLYIKVYCKRLRGAYVKERRQYGAYLAYHFSDDIDQFIADNIKQSVNFVRQRLEDMSYTIYDEAKDGYYSQYKAENIKSMIRQCHRIIIFLTLGYMKDDWSLQTLYEGLDQMISSGTKLIFILHPGIKKYLKQHQNDVENYEKTETAKICCLIKRAIYLNYAIEWSMEEKFDVKSFNLQLELAMPKLKPKNDEELL